MYNAEIERLKNERMQKIRLFNNKEPLSYGRVLRLWQCDEKFRSLFISVLSEAPYPSFRWETPALSEDTANRIFECVILDDPSLANSADATQFRHFLNRSRETERIVAFPNLGKDAVLIVPKPESQIQDYAHIASFTRKAPEDQNHALWRIVGENMEKMMGSKPIWLNTAGGGVPWLHVRLDSHPKYYRYYLYKNPVPITL